MKYLRLTKSIICIIFILNLISCSNEDNNVNEVDNLHYDIGFSLATLNEDRWLKDRDIFVAGAKEFGVSVDVQNANNNSNVQLAQVEAMIKNGIKVLVIVPNDADQAIKIMEIARENKIKTICYDRIVKKANTDLYISFDHIEVGRIFARFLISAVPKGNYVIINGPENDYNCTYIKEGYMEILQPKLKDGSINIISNTSAKNWNPEVAKETIQKLLASNFQIDAVLAGNDKLAGGVISALSEKSLANNVKVVSQDADLAACQRIVEGTQDLTVYKPIDKLARKAAEMAVKMLKGEEEEIDKYINDGKYEVPFHVINIWPINKDNLYDIIVKKEAFHRMEDVYILVDKNKWPK